VRVAIVCPYAWDRVGGVQSHVRALGRALTRRGHEVQILAPSSLTLTHQVGGPGNVKLVGRAIGVPVNGSIAPLTFGPLAAAGIRTALHDLEPDVLHLHEPLIPSLSLLALLNSRTPAVGTFHASAEGSIGYRLAKPVLRRALERLKIRTAVSDAARSLIGGYYPGEYLLTPNGVDVERFATAEPLDLAPGKKILFLGRLEQRKGLDVVIRAMSHLSDLDAELIVAGTGPEEARNRTLAKRMGVRVRFLGRLGEEELPRAYRSADVYCAPGLGGESFGVVLLEALAAGAPVVCSNLEGYRAVAEGAAELVPPGQVTPLAAALRKVLTDEDHAAHLRKLSRRKAANFDWERLVVGVQAIYERALSGHQRRLER
jgi:phosphatidylinositol alpha-mannosyltransferase